jgi:hypothetical protein
MGKIDCGLGALLPFGAMREAAQGSARGSVTALASLQMVWQIAWQLAWLIPGVLVGASRADALANDLQIPALGNPSTDPTAVQRFRMLSDELGMSLSSTTLEPARTVGSDGFDVALEVAVAFINTTTQLGGEGYWATAGAASSPLIIPAVHVRKGLPYSFEIGGRLMAITDSGMYAGQAEVKWAFIEGFRYLPDLSARAALTQLFSQEDLNLTTGAVDLTLGKEFGIAGLFTLAPYLGYALTAIEADSNAFWSGGVTESQYLQNPLAGQVRYAPTSANRLSWNDNFYDRFYGGLVLRSHIVSFNVEYDYARPNAWSGASFVIHPGLSTLGLRVAFTF